MPEVEGRFGARRPSSPSYAPHEVRRAEGNDDDQR